MSNPTTKQPHDTRAKEPRLTLKQEAACLAYVETRNKSEAYRRGFDCSKMKPATVNSKAKEFFDREKIRARCDELWQPIVEKSRITSETVLAEIAKLSFSNVQSLFDDQGRLLPVHMLPADVAASVSSVKVTTKTAPGGEPTDVDFVTEVKFWDKRGSLELLGKHLKLFNDVGSKENPLHIDKLPDEMLDARLAALMTKG